MMTKDFKLLIRIAVFVLLLTAATMGLTVPALAEGELKRLSELEPGTIVEFAGQDWIVLDPAAGYVLRKEALPYELPLCFSERYITLSAINYVGNIGTYLNANDYERENRTGGIGYLEEWGPWYPWHAAKVLSRTWTMGTDIDEAVGSSLSLKIGLLSYSEYQLYKDLLGEPIACNWWLRTIREDKHKEIWYVNKEGELESAFHNYDIGMFARPAMNIDPYVIAINVGNGYIVNEQNVTLPLRVAPVAAPGQFDSTTSILASPNQSGGSLTLKISKSELSVPDNFSTAPSGDGVINSYISSTMFNAQAGDYIGVYDLNKDGLVIGFSQVRLTEDDIRDNTATQVAISPNGGGPFTVANPQTVTIAVPVGYTAYYTTDNSDPRTSDTKIEYTKSFTVNQSTIIKARYLFGSNWTPITQADFGFQTDLHPVVAAFNPAAPADVRITVRPNGNRLTSIKEGDHTLISGTDYRLSSFEADITKEYLAARSGPVTLTFYFSAGNPVSITIPRVGEEYQNSAVTYDSTSLFIIPNLYDKNPDGDHHRDIRINVTYNGNALLRIRNGGSTLNQGADYTVDGDSVIIAASYFSKQSQSNPTKLSFDFNAGATAATADISFLIADTSKLPGGPNFRFSLDSNDNEYFLLGNSDYIYVKAAKNQSRWGRELEAGKTYIIAGNGIEGYDGDNGPATKARIWVDLNENQLVTDDEGNLYFMSYVDTYTTLLRRRVMRMIPAADGRRFGIDMQAGYIYTILGGGSETLTVAGAANARDLLFTMSLRSHAVDSAGNLYFTGHNSECAVIGKVDVQTSAVTIVAGTGTQGTTVSGELATETPIRFKLSYIKVDSEDNLYFVPDSGELYMIPRADINRFGQSMEAGHIYKLAQGYTTCMGLYIDKNGNIFIAHFFDHNIAVLMAKSQVLYGVPREAGQYYVLHLGVGWPFDIFLDSTGDMYFAYNNANDNAKMMTPYNNAVLTGILGREPHEMQGENVVAYDVPYMIEKDGASEWRTKLYPDDFNTLSSRSKVFLYSSYYQDNKFRLAGSLDYEGRFGNATEYIAVVSEDGTKTKHYKIEMRFENVVKHPLVGKVVSILGQPVHVTSGDGYSGNAIAAINVPYSASKLRNADIVTLLAADRPYLGDPGTAYRDAPSYGKNLNVGLNIVDVTIASFDSMSYRYKMTIHRAAEDTTLEGLEITSPPKKLVYKIGESLDLEGLVVSGLYSDGYPVVLQHSELQVSGFDSSTPSRCQTLTVTVGDATAAYTVKIYDPVSGFPIETKEDLELLRTQPIEYCVLMNDIDLEGMEWTPFETFSGIFDGRGHTISNFSINQSGTINMGFFKIIDSGAIVKNLTLEDFTINAKGYAGGIAGTNNGVIQNCSVNGTVTGSSDNIGGLAGFNDNGWIMNSGSTGDVTGGTFTNVGGLVGLNQEGSIIGCFASGDVSSNNGYVGGLVGCNRYGHIASCFATGNISSNSDYIGGLVGSNNDVDAITINCYAVGAVTGVGSNVGGLAGRNGGKIVSSYYNTETCGAGANNGRGTGKTTMELKQQATFEGWDFSDGGIWRIEEESTYPMLQWQFASQEFDYDLSLNVQTGEQSVTVTANVEKLNSEVQDGVLILALYYKNRLIDIYVDNGLTGNTYQTSTELHHTGYVMSEDIHVAGFVWDSRENMRPLALCQRWCFNN